MPSQKDIIIGKITSVHGVKGALKVISYTEPSENILRYAPWKLLKGGHSRTVQLANSQFKPNGLIVYLIGCTDRDQAYDYAGSEIAVNREQLPAIPADEYYWTDLENMDVVTNNNYLLGKVDHVLATGSNDVLVVKGEKRHLIPFLLNDVILDVNFDTHTIRVDWDPDF